MYFLQFDTVFKFYEIHFDCRAQDTEGHHSSDEDKCLLCNLENGSKMSGPLENGSKVSELKVSTAAAGSSVAHEPGASGQTHAVAGDQGMLYFSVRIKKIIELVHRTSR